MSATDTEVQTKVKLKTPSLYKVMILNDNYTPMEFVIEVFKQIFNKSHSEAHIITMQIHDEGKGLAGVFSKEVAQQKVMEVHTAGQRNGHPLRAVLELA